VPDPYKLDQRLRAYNRIVIVGDYGTGKRQLLGKLLPGAILDQYPDVVISRNGEMFYDSGIDYEVWALNPKPSDIDDYPFILNSSRVIVMCDPSDTFSVERGLRYFSLLYQGESHPHRVHMVSNHLNVMPGRADNASMIEELVYNGVPEKLAGELVHDINTKIASPEEVASLVRHILEDPVFVF
jgi:hypothetical protein